MYFMSSRQGGRVTPSSTGVVGLDIGSHSLKAAVLEKKEAFFYLKQSRFSVFSTDARTPVQRADAIKKLLNEADIGTTQCVTALSDVMVNSRWLRFDQSVAHDLETAIQWTIEEQAPRLLDTLYFDYQVFAGASTDSHEAYFDVLLVLCRKEYLDRHLEVLSYANLKPLFIEVNSHALERAYATFYPDEPIDQALIIEISASQMTFLFTAENQRCHSYSEKNIDQMDSTTRLQKIQRIVNELLLGHTNLRWKKILLLGANPTLIAFLQKELNDYYSLAVEVITLSPYLLFASAPPDEITEREIFSNLFLSLGLALRGCLSE
jgi:Tfp pilus assembly PilM family ATPase